MSESHPGASSFVDRHGKERWRYRNKGKTSVLPGDPAASPAFEAAYLAAVEGRTAKVGQIVHMPRAIAPRSIRAAWNIARKSTDHLEDEPETRAMRERRAELFLATRGSEAGSLTWGDMPIADLKRRHIKSILASYSETPHMGRHWLAIIRKIITAALDEEWIETDPTHKISHRPAYQSWRAWTAKERAMYEARWPVGTPARLAYELALWLGNRRGDVARLRRDQRHLYTGPGGEMIDEFRFEQGKTGKEMILPITASLAACIAASDQRGETILVSTRGTPYDVSSLGGMMREWMNAAGLPFECKMHGLRKALGAMAADSGASTKQIMELLGHKRMSQAELYTRDANQRRLTRDAMNVIEIGEKKRG